MSDLRKFTMLNFSPKPNDQQGQLTSDTVLLNAKAMCIFSSNFPQPETEITQVQFLARKISDLHQSPVDKRSK